MAQSADFWRGTATGGGVMAVVGAAAVVTVLVVGGGDGGDSATTAGPTPVATQSVAAEPTPVATADAGQGAGTGTALMDLARRDADDGLAIGDIDAPVLMIEWADLRCSYCARFANETLPTLIQDYVDNGTLRIEWHSAPVLGGTSPDAAVAAYAAAEQGLGFQFVEAAFATSPNSQTQWTTEKLIEVAGQVEGLDVEQFTTDLADADIRATAIAAGQEATTAGVDGTPKFMVNGYEIKGAQPLENFRQVIDSMTL